MMTFSQVMEIIRRDSPDKTPVEVAMDLNGYYQDICNTVEPSTQVIEITSDGETTSFVHSEIDASIPAIFMKSKEVRIKDLIVRDNNHAIIGDVVVEWMDDGFILGKWTSGGIAPLNAGLQIEYEFYNYPPPITLQTTVLPFPWSHGMILWRIKADQYAERRHWDRAGYYNRRYENSLRQFKLMYKSSGPQRTINTNTRI